MIQRTYSPYFSTVYDQQEPVGSYGRGVHYSILSATIWHDELARPTREAYTKRFCVLWDEDHDERVIRVAEALFLKGLLGTLDFVGERKGILTLGWSSVSLPAKRIALMPKLKSVAEETFAVISDWWQIDFIEVIVGSADCRDLIYEQHIRLLWSLDKELARMSSDALETVAITSPDSLAD